MRSILFTKQMRGTRYLSAWRHTVSDCGCTPATESNTHTAPSRTRSERSTSTVKSTWPGVSIILTRNFLSKLVTEVVDAAFVFDYPPPRPVSVQHLWAVPSSP